MEIFLLMLVGHVLADFPLQGEWLSKAKNHKLDLVGEKIWPISLASHSLIHAAIIFLITGSWLLVCLEFISHSIIDYVKCDGKIGYNLDQILHVACKVVWSIMIVYGIY